MCTLIPLFVPFTLSVPLCIPLLVLLLSISSCFYLHHSSQLTCHGIHHPGEDAFPPRGHWTLRKGNWKGAGDSGESGRMNYLSDWFVATSKGTATTQHRQIPGPHSEGCGRSASVVCRSRVNCQCIYIMYVERDSENWTPCRRVMFSNRSTQIWRNCRLITRNSLVLWRDL